MTDETKPKRKLVFKGEVLHDLDCCEKTLYNLIESGHFPAPLRIGRRRCWLRYEYDAFFETKHREAQQAGKG